MKELPSNVSEATKKRNPHLWPSSSAVGAAQNREPEQKPASALVKKSPGKKTRKGSVVQSHGAARALVRVALIAYRSRTLDSDNLGGSLKGLRDEIALWLGLDDRDDVIEWSYGQVVTRGSEGVVVTIELAP